MKLLIGFACLVFVAFAFVLLEDLFFGKAKARRRAESEFYKMMLVGKGRRFRR